MTYDMDITDIITLLNNNRLREALVQLNAKVMSESACDMLGEIEELQNNYRMMLSYEQTNSNDPNRTAIWQQLMAKAWGLLERFSLRLDLKRNKSAFYMPMQDCRDMPLATFAELNAELTQLSDEMNALMAEPDDNHFDMPAIRQKSQQIDTARCRLFASAACQVAWSKDDYETALIMLKCEANSPFTSHDVNLALMVSATYLSLLSIYDERKLLFLMEAAKYSKERVSRRAIVALALVMDYKRMHIDLQPNILQRWHDLTALPQVQAAMFDVQVQLLMARESSKIGQRMVTEILPNIIKKANEINLHIISSQSNEDLDNDQMEYMNELKDLIQEGGDVYLNTIGSMHRDKFFFKYTHHFLPFTFLQPNMLENADRPFPKPNSPINIILGAGFFCDSDRYALYFMMKDNMVQITKQFQAELPDDIPHFDPTSQGENEKPSLFSQYFIQDLQRYFKTQRNPLIGKEMLTTRYILWDEPEFRHIFNEKQIKHIAQFLMDKGHFTEAIDALTYLTNANVTNYQYWFLLGVALQKCDKYALAIKAFERADMISEGKKECIRRIAQCYKKIGHYDKALAYYQQLQTDDGKAKNVNNNIALCLIKTKRYEEALPYLHKANYLNEENPETLSRLGLCYLFTNRFDEALKYYQKALALMPDDTDCAMNTAHILWILDRKAEAIDMYHKAEDLANSHDAFVHLFWKDAPVLRHFGKSTTDMALMCDLMLL